MHHYNSLSINLVFIVCAILHKKDMYAKVRVNYKGSLLVVSSTSSLLNGVATKFLRLPKFIELWAEEFKLVLMLSWEELRRNMMFYMWGM